MFFAKWDVIHLPLQVFPFDCFRGCCPLSVPLFNLLFVFLLFKDYKWGGNADPGETNIMCLLVESCLSIGRAAETPSERSCSTNIKQLSRGIFHDSREDGTAPPDPPGEFDEAKKYN